MHAFPPYGDYPSPRLSSAPALGSGVFRGQAAVIDLGNGPNLVDKPQAGMVVERVYKVKEGRPNVVDLIKGDRIQLIVNTPHGQDTFFDERAIRRAAVLQRIPTITTIAAARAAAEGIAALQEQQTTVYPLQELHAATATARN